MDLVEYLVFLCSCIICLRSTYGQLSRAQGWDTDKFKEEASQTFNLVFHKYNHRVRPPQAYIEITVNITLRHIRQLSMRKQELQTVLDIEMDWQDSRLKWYPDRVYQIMANTSMVWSPDIVYTNSIEATKVLYPNAVKINHTGRVFWTRKEVVSTHCPTDPDSQMQNCAIRLGFMSNTYNDQTDRFFSNSSSFNLPVNFVNHEWHLMDAELDLEVGNVTQRASNIEINLWLQQQSSAGSQEVVLDKDEDDEGYTSFGTTADCRKMEELRGGKENAQPALCPSVGVITLLVLLTSFVSGVPSPGIVGR